MDDEGQIIEHFYGKVGMNQKPESLEAFASALQDGKSLLALLQAIDPTNIWSLFSLDGANFHGAFLFVRFCNQRGYANVPDPFDIIAGRDPEALLSCLREIFSVCPLLSSCHSGPKADDFSDSCSCLLCRWKSALRVISGRLSVSIPNSVRRLVEEGIPSCVREHVWLVLSGALRLVRTRPPMYSSLFPRALSDTNTYLQLIDLDISRTYTEDAFWRENGHDVQTRRILAAYSVRNQTVGYCQGLSYIAGLLVTVASEEAAFAILCAILEDGLMPPDYYTSLNGAVVDRQVLEQLVHKFIPNLVVLLDSNLSDYTFMTIPWHMCLFSTTLSRACSIRIWDYLFAFGPSILFRCSLGILADLESSLSNVSLSQVRDRLKSIEQKTVESDISLYSHAFRECTNELVESLRNSLHTNAPCFMAVSSQTQCSVADTGHFGQPPKPSVPRKRREMYETQKFIVEGLGDFLGQ